MSLDYDHYKNGGLLKDRYLKVEDISEGAYGIVSLAEDTYNDRKLVAVKYITQFTDLNNGDEKVVTPQKANELDVSKSGSIKISDEENRRVVLEEAQQEINILKKLGSHPNITQLYDSFDSYLVLEYCSRGDLYEIIRGSCGPTSTKDIVDVMSQLIEAVTYAHNLGIYHRDIKPENILVSEDWTVKLTDWGLATDHHTCTDFDVGSERYMAPELFDSKNIKSYEAAKCDIWSIGICLLNIVFGKNPFTVANQSDKLFVNFAANRETIFDIFPTLSYELFGVLRHALTIDPDNRDLESMKQELLKVKHLTLDYDLESYVSDNDNKIVEQSQERSKSNPVIATSPERKFVRGNRKPLAIPSRQSKDNNNNGYYNKYNQSNNNNNNNNNSSYNRQDFFTPKSVFNNYMDKIDKNHIEQRNNEPNRNGNRYYKRRNPNKRAWRKSYKKQPAKNNYSSDGVFLKPISVKKISPPSSRDILRSNPRNKRYSANSYSSSAGKYVPPGLRSPNLEAHHRPDVAIIDDTDDDFNNADDDDDDLFMLEEYKHSPKNAIDRKKASDLSFNYPNSKSTRGASSKLQNQILISTATNIPPLNNSNFLTPVSMISSSSTGSSGKYVPPHHRRNSHSAVLHHKSKQQQQKNKRNSFMSATDFEPSSVPSSWSNKNDKLSKINQKYNKNYSQDDFSVNDMYHTFAKMRFDSNNNKNNNGKNSLNVFTSDDDDRDEEEEYSSLKNTEFKFASRAIPSYTS